MITNYLAVYNHIVEKEYYDFETGKTPGSTISAAFGDFIRNGDSRVKSKEKFLHRSMHMIY